MNPFRFLTNDVSEINRIVNRNVVKQGISLAKSVDLRYAIGNSSNDNRLDGAKGMVKGHFLRSGR